MSYDPAELMARGMSSRYQMERRPQGDNRSKFELSEPDQQTLLALWLGADRQLLDRLMAEQMGDWTVSLRTIDVGQIESTRAKIDGLQHFWNRVAKTVEAIREVK